MDFSGRRAALYVSLGRDGTTRRRSLMDDGGSTDVERFLGSRLHGFTTIVHVVRGAGFVISGAGRVPIGAGDIAVLPPGLIAYGFTGGRRVETLALRVHLDAGPIVRAADLPGDLFERSDRAIIDLLRDAPALAHVTRTSSERSVMHALERLDVRPSLARLTTVAHDLGYTADGLSSLLARHTGTGFAAWRDALTMAHVRAALTTEKPVARIARDLDLDRNYLHRRFARSHGATPAVWRRAPEAPRLALAHDWDSVLRYFRRLPAEFTAT